MIPNNKAIIFALGVAVGVFVVPKIREITGA